MMATADDVFELDRLVREYRQEVKDVRADLDALRLELEGRAGHRCSYQDDRRADARPGAGRPSPWPVCTVRRVPSRRRRATRAQPVKTNAHQFVLMGVPPSPEEVSRRVLLSSADRCNLRVLVMVIRSIQRRLTRRELRSLRPFVRRARHHQQPRR